MARYRRTTDGRRMTLTEAHVLAALADGSWYSIDDLWDRSTVLPVEAQPILERLYRADLLQASRDRGETVNSHIGQLRWPGTWFRLNDRGKRYARNQDELPLARWPWGLDLLLARWRR